MVARALVVVVVVGTAMTGTAPAAGTPTLRVVPSATVATSLAPRAAAEVAVWAVVGTVREVVSAAVVVAGTVEVTAAAAEATAEAAVRASAVAAVRATAVEAVRATAVEAVAVGSTHQVRWKASEVGYRARGRF